MYQLEKYKGKATRHECPSCHDHHSFAYYVDENGDIIDPSCGRCNHESGCGYHYTPSQYFRDNPSNCKPAQPKQVAKPKHKPIIKKVCTIDYGYLFASMFAYQVARYWNNFDLFLRTLFDEKVISNLHRLYFNGLPNSTDKEATIFWQVDSNWKLRAGKIIRYGCDGHRIKTTNVNWVHSDLKKQKQLSEDWELNQCLFGEHLLNLYPDKPVALVEAEKTAIICSGFYPKYIWVASGGKSQLSPEKLKVLARRNVIAFPDIDGTKEWNEKLQSSKVVFRNLKISDLLEKNATAEERERKIDIADWLVRLKGEGKINAPSPEHPLGWLFDDDGNLRIKPEAERPRSDLELMIDNNPFIQTMIDELNLTPSA